MVQALLEGRKTQTRRTKGLEAINETPQNYKYKGVEENEDDCYRGFHLFEYINTKYPPETYHLIQCPYNVGDVFWVRETCLPLKIVDVFDNEQILYRTDPEAETFIKEIKGKWKPSIFMPKHACLTFLKIKSIKIERLQDISEADAKAEGAKDRLRHSDLKVLEGLKGWNIPSPFREHQFGFLSIWCNINGCESWLANPFVWVYEFEQIAKPSDFI